MNKRQKKKMAKKAASERRAYIACTFQVARVRQQQHASLADEMMQIWRDMKVSGPATVCGLPMEGLACPITDSAP